VKHLTVDSIKAMLETITPGHWRYDHPSERLENEYGMWMATVQTEANGSFIADAPRIVRWLLAENTRITERLDLLRKMTKELHAVLDAVPIQDAWVGLDATDQEIPMRLERILQGYQLELNEARKNGNDG
jgi:hypothetical protein